MKKVTAVVAGAGLRGMEAYAVYALEHPEELEIVAVAEPNPARREKFAADHHLPPERVFTTWEDLLAQPRLADAALICTQERMHYAPVLAALDKGYHVLCEKPMSPNKQEILAMAGRGEGRAHPVHLPCAAVQPLLPAAEKAAGRGHHQAAW